MPGRQIELPKTGFAIEIDGLLKTEFSTGEGRDERRSRIEAPLPDASDPHLRRGPQIEIRTAGVAATSAPISTSEIRASDGTMETRAGTA